MQPLQRLCDWATRHNSYVHPGISIDQEDDEFGVRFRAKEHLPTGTVCCRISHAIALSSLNALVDDDFHVFHVGDLAIEAIGYFYLAHQYLLSEKSFWWPYISTLPQPSDEHSTPFWFDELDRSWLADTDVEHTMLARLATQQQNYDQGILQMQYANIDTEPYTWHLYKWAMTMFTSRAFSSVALESHATSHWLAYKSGPDGVRQSVLLDMSTAKADDLKFPVLLPVLDVTNHRLNARVNLLYDAGLAGISLHDAVEAGEEVFNNYGPKGNDELLLGYGFCIPSNPYDKVLLTLKEPSPILRNNLFEVHRDYFASDGSWDGAKATFGLHRSTVADGLDSMFDLLPDGLLLLLVHTLRTDRGLPFTTMSNARNFVKYGIGGESSYGPSIAQMIVQSLAPKMTKLQVSTPRAVPSNYRQSQAQTYRQGQIEILNSVIQTARDYVRSLLYAHGPTQQGSRLFTLEDLLGAVAFAGYDTTVREYLVGVKANAGTDDVDELRSAGWEDDLLALLLCSLHLIESSPLKAPDYIIQSRSGVDLSSHCVDGNLTDDELDHGLSLMELVQRAAQHVSDSFWSDARWSASYIAGVGGKIMKFDSFPMHIASELDKQASSTVKTVVYLQWSR